MAKLKHRPLLPDQLTMLKILSMLAHLCELVTMFILLQTLVYVQASDQFAPSSTTDQTSNRKISFKNYHNFQEPLVWDETSLYHYNPKQNAPTKNTRHKRAPSSAATQPGAQAQVQQAFVDACQSKMEVLTPYYAANSKGKIRIIVNSELMQQAIQVETCVRSAKTNQHSDVGRCNAQPDCGCEQKYKWHRLLVMEHPNESGGSNKSLFMDWFLFPSSCVCRCRSATSNLLIPSSSKSLMSTISPQARAQHLSLLKPVLKPTGV